jgi:uncharacterized protein (TIGR00269 family)
MGIEKCSDCTRNRAFFFRPYSGENLCKRCFAKSVENQVSETLAKYAMLDGEEKLAIAVSGGKDSVSLLHILTEIRQDYPKLSLVAVTVDEGIQRYRDEALEIAVENCKKLSIEHRTLSFKNLYGYTLDQIVEHLQKKETMRLTPCAFCGVLRRKALNVVAREVKADKIATAHTLDDETQTTLLNILHGNPLRIAKVQPITNHIHPKLIRRIKPFCEISERETTLYAYTNKIKFQSIPCPYAPEAMRNDIRVFLNRIEKKRAGTKFVVFKSMQTIRPAVEKLFRKENPEGCIKCGEPAAAEICRACEMLNQLFRDN